VFVQAVLRVPAERLPGIAVAVMNRQQQAATGAADTIFLYCYQKVSILKSLTSVKPFLYEKITPAMHGVHAGNGRQLVYSLSKTLQRYSKKLFRY
jgi:hypothetical protein